MKLLAGIFTAVAVGVALGWGVARQHVKSPAWDGLPAVEAVAPGQPTPRVAVDHEAFDFGLMNSGSERSHAFQFTNEGNAPLTLKAGSTSCRCTVTQVEKEALAPGESGNVRVEWKSKGVSGEYSQTAKIETNDPARPELTLTVSGEVTEALRAEPSELIFSSLGMQQTVEADVRLWCYLPGKPLEVTSGKFARDSTASFFSLTHEPISEAEVRKEKNAQSGVLLHLTLKPGLPQGEFQQTILIGTNLPEANHIEIPIEGALASDIVVAGPFWDGSRSMLDFGAIKRQSGALRPLRLIVRGPHAAETKFKVARVEPDYLRVTLGETAPTGSSPSFQIFQTTLSVEVPANSPLESHLGPELGRLGNIVLETTHPQVPQLNIYVRFAVEGGR